MPACGLQRRAAQPDDLGIPDLRRPPDSSTSGLPVTVSASGSSRSRDLAQHGEQPAGTVEVLHQEPAGRLQVDQQGTSAPVRSKSSSVRSMPSRPAMASRWTTALVDPPIAASATIALRNEPAGQQRARRRRSATISTASRAGLVRGLEQPAVRRRACRPGRGSCPERLGHAAPWSRPCPSCCSARGCGSSTTRTAMNSRLRQRAGADLLATAATRRCRSRAAGPGTCR